jgi:chorismate lyase/3-hydroxybenzoate synthase
MSDASVPEVPSWVRPLVQTPPRPEPPPHEVRPDGFARRAPRLHVRSLRGRDFALVSVRIEEADTLHAAAFRRATADAYDAIDAEIHGHAMPEPVRVWNFVPGILDPLDDLPHRYMAFNAGRWDAYLRRHGTAERMTQNAPTGTGTGHRGRDLVIHCLAAREPGESIENPRQVPSWRYSTRYGPHPPCFARATRIEREGGPWLLIGGTASVVGEDCVHPGDVEAQVAETLRNLDAVVTAGAPASGRPAGAPASGRPATPKSVRVYFVRDEDESLVRDALRERFGASTPLELVAAELCRPELLVEIEAVYQYAAADQTAAA